MSSKSNPLVAVYMVTYNHEKFIAQAIESVLMQKTNFPIKLFIGEDCSIDGTAAIAKEYSKKYPELIEARCNNVNIGMVPNAIKTLEECRGKYIAFCEGDDYWIDPYKLQKQIDFLEGNPSYSSCAHQCTVIAGENNEKGFPYNIPDKADFRTEDLLGNRHFHTGSFVFRSSVMNDRPIPDNITSADRAIFFLCSLFGPIRFLNETMAVYRKHPGGIFELGHRRLDEKGFEYGAVDKVNLSGIFRKEIQVHGVPWDSVLPIES